MLRIFVILLVLSFKALGQDFHLTGDLSPKEKDELSVTIHKLMESLPKSFTSHLPRLNFRVRPSSDIVSNESVCLLNDKKIVFASYQNGLITLNQAVVKALLGGASEARPLVCTHPDTFTYAKSVLIHELAHAYDLNRFDSVEEKSDYIHCLRKKRNAKIKGISQACQALLKKYQNSSRVSQTSEFKRRTYWQGVIPHNNNEHPQRAHDLYQYKNAYETFAVNFEYYILDENFRCKKPVLADLYDTLFYGEVQKKCERKFNQVVTRKDGSYLKHNLLADRVYQIDLVYVSKGKSLASRFGHTLIRVVLCAPERMNPYDQSLIHQRKVSSDCLQDTDYHVYFSFAADLPGPEYDALRGLTGQYNLKLFALNYSEVKQKYLIHELRDLHYYKLGLSDSDKKLLLNRLVEQYWQYTSNYHYLWDNCATEMQDTFRLIFDLDSDLIKSPSGLIREFKNKEFIASEPNEIKRNYLSYYLKAADYLNLKIKNKKQLLDYLLSPRTFEYERIYAAIEGQEDKTLRRKMISAFSFLESYRIKRIQNEIMGNIYDFLKKDQVSFILRDYFPFSVSSDYGIPMEDIQLNEYTQDKTLSLYLEYAQQSSKEELKLIEEIRQEMTAINKLAVK